MDDDDDFNENKHRFQDTLAVLFSLYRKEAELCGRELPPPPSHSELVSWEHWRPGQDLWGGQASGPRG